MTACTYTAVLACLAQECINLIVRVLQEETAAKDLQHLQTVKAYEAILATKRGNIERQRVRPCAVLASVVLGYSRVMSDASVPADAAALLHTPRKCLVHTASDSMVWAMS